MIHRSNPAASGISHIIGEICGPIPEGGPNLPVISRGEINPRQTHVFSAIYRAETTRSLQLHPGPTGRSSPKLEEKISQVPVVKKHRTSEFVDGFFSTRKFGGDL